MTERVGIDLGGTKIEGVVMSRERAILRRERIATPHTYHEIVRAVAELIAIRALCLLSPDRVFADALPPAGLHEAITRALESARSDPDLEVRRRSREATRRLLHPRPAA